MKLRHTIQQWIKPHQSKAARLLAGLAFAGAALAASNSFAASDIFFEPTVANTDILTGNGHWQNAWGDAAAAVPGGVSFEPTNPPPTGATGGSVFLQGNWTAANTGGWDAMHTVWRGGWYDASGDNFDGAQYEYLIMDIMYDTNSTMPAPSASWTIGLDQGWSHTELTNYTFVPDGQWHHLVIPISLSQPNVGSTCGVSFYTWKPGGTVGTMNFWVANVQLIARTVPIAPPTVSLEKVGAPGLAMFADKLPSYLRGNVRTDTTGSANVDWVGQASSATPVSYSWTISQFPGPGHAGHRSDLVLTPDPVASLVSADPDWSATNCLWISIQANADGTVGAGIAFKTNQVNGNSQMNPGGDNLLTGGHTLAAPTAVGTWTLTFSNNTDMTLTAPNGSSTNVSLPADVAATYTGISMFLITAMGNDGNVGQSVTYSALNTTGTATIINEDFTTGALTSPNLALMNQGYLFPWNLNPPSHRWITSASKYWLTWTIPDTGFSPVSSAILPGGPLDWAPRDLTNSFLNSTKKWALVNANNLPAGNNAFFALIKRVPSKLQTLLASETNAPGTLTGKVGTIDPVVANTVIAVTVHSVDASWYIGGGAVGDTVELGIDPVDPLAVIAPATAALANGTVTFNVQFGTAGSYTITATNITNGSITAGTSGTITVTP
ncbi:MAG: hypothetical protein AAB370_12300 [Verrucomicrobiota bacterium]